MSQNSVNLKLLGLYTHSNPLGSVPEGSLAEAKNIVITRDNVAEPRRGNKQYGNTFGISTDRARQITSYKDVVLRHVLSNLQYDSNGLGEFLDFVGATNVNETEPGLRIKSIEANGNFYYATSSGIKKLSARNAADFPLISQTDAGGVKALDVTASPDFSQTGFLLPDSKVAYRVLWNIKDRNDNLIQGTPSSRTVVFNATTSSSIVKLQFAVPADVTNTQYFYQVYRTGVFAQSPTEVDPGEEFQLVFEDFVTAPEITAGLVVVEDITPEEFRKQGTFLYTNPSSGAGIESANEKPPFAKDIASYKGYTFYSNTSTVQRLTFAFLSVVGLYPTNTKTFSVSDGLTTNTYTFQGSFETFTADYTGLAFIDLYNAAPGPAKYFEIESASDETKYYVWYYFSVNDEDPLIPGRVGIKVDISALTLLSEAIDETLTTIMNESLDFNVVRVADTLLIKCANNGFVKDDPVVFTIPTPFTLTKDNAGTGQDASMNKIFLPRVPTGAIGDTNGPTTAQQLEQVARSLVNVLNIQDNIVSAFYTSDFDTVPGQILLEQRDPVGPAFFITSNAGDQFNPTLPSMGNGVISTNEVSPNRIYYSKFQQPEAVPLANFTEIGPKDRAIKRILALRDSLFILKEEGIYRLSGEVDPFTVALFDSSAQIIAPDSAVVLNNQIYAWTTQGVITITDSGVSIISRAIENKLLFVSSQNPVYETASFGVSYETERSYILWFPTTANDVVATQALVYNTFENVWVEWTNSATCGLVNFGNDRLYIGAGDLNIVEEERKSLTRTDHADRQYDRVVQLNGVIDNIIELTTVNEVEVGDVLVQTQYLTASQFNRTLGKLDLDTLVNDTDYLSLLRYLPSQDMRAKLVALANKLDVDLGVSDTDYFAAIAPESNSITSTTLGPNLVITLTNPNTIRTGRWVNISGAGLLNGQYQVIAHTPTTITINKTLLTPVVMGTVTTLDNDFRDYQGCYNIITNKLNNDPGVFFANYPLSVGTVEFELVIQAFDVVNNTVTVPNQQVLLFGDITLFKHIDTRITWNQQFFGDPTTEKQVREMKLLYENNNFSKLLIKFATDRSPNFEGNEYTIFAQGIGDFGQFSFGDVNFGGVATPTPIRDYIPRNKQRCTFIFARVEHGIAREKFSLLGISLNFRPYNVRITR